MVSRVLNSRIVVAFLLAVLLLPAVFAQEAFAQETTREDALAAIAQAELDIAEMAGAGLGVRSVNDTLIAANRALERADFAELLNTDVTGEVAELARSALEGLDYSGFSYADVFIYTDEIASRKQQGYALVDSLRAMELKIEEYSTVVDTSEPEALLDEARVALGYERYGETENLVSRTNTVLDLKRAERTTVTVIVNSSRSFLEDNWHWLALVGALAALIGWFVWEKLRLRHAEHQLKKLMAEKRALLRLMKRVQTERFKKRTMSKSIYELRRDKYKTRLNQIEHTIPVLRSVLKPSRGKKDEEQEEEEQKKSAPVDTEKSEKPKQEKSGKK